MAEQMREHESRFTDQREPPQMEERESPRVKEREQPIPSPSPSPAPSSQRQRSYWPSRLTSALGLSSSAHSDSEASPFLLAEYKTVEQADHDHDEDPDVLLDEPSTSLDQKRHPCFHVTRSALSLLVLAAAGLIAVVLLVDLGFYSGHLPFSLAPRSPRQLATNATLGFEKIFALTRGTSWRLDGLHAAAKFTGLVIEEPQQVPINDAVVEAFQALGTGMHPARGAALAWLAHVNLLEFVMQNKLRSALIVEDDVDWDVALLQQMPAISDAMRSFSESSSDSPDPYGDNWDVLWLGHCGEWSDIELPYFAWPDKTVIPHSTYSGFAKEYINQLPEGHRTINPTAYTVCSFAYGVSYEGAPKVLAAMNHGDGEAFDVALSAACRTDPTLRCYTIHPEVMHHYVPYEGISSEVQAENGDALLATDDMLIMEHGTTDNIVNSARCHVLWQSQCIGTTWTK